MVEKKISNLEDCIKKKVDQYFLDLNGGKPHAIYEMVMSAVEKTLIEIILKKNDGNQTHTATMLGIDRNTLRKKINCYKLLSNH